MFRFRVVALILSAVNQEARLFLLVVSILVTNNNGPTVVSSYKKNCCLYYFFRTFLRGVLREIVSFFSEREDCSLVLLTHTVL